MDDRPDRQQESDCSFRAVFDSVNDAIFVHDAVTGEVLDVNRRACELYGYPQSELIELSIGEISSGDPPYTHEHGLELVAEAARGFPQVCEWHARGNGGRLFWVEVSLRRAQLEGGERVLVVARDITERKQAQDEILRTQELYRELVHNTNSIIIRWDRDGVLTFFNEFAQSFFGFSESEILGRNVVGTIVPETETSGRDLVEMIRDICAHPERHETNINENMLKDGTRVWIAWTNKLVFDEQGELSEILSVGLDITARRKAEEAAWERQAKIDSIFRAAPTGIGMVVNRVLSEVNDRILEMTGYSRDELIGQSARILYPTQEDYDYVGSAKYDLIARYGTGTVETRMARKDGSVFDVILSSTPLDVNDHSKGVTFTILDITERKKAENALQETTSMLKLVLDTIPSLVFWKNLSGVYLGCNRLFAANAGLDSADEIVGKTDLVLPWKDTEAESYRADDRRVIESGNPKLNYEETQLTAAGTLAWVKTSKIPLRDSNGDIVGVLGTSEDITERKRVEAEKRRFYRETIKSVTQGKLDLVSSTDIESYVASAEYSVTIEHAAETADVRHHVHAVLTSSGLAKEQSSLFMTGVGEAMNNALKHAGEGTVFAGSDNQLVWVGVSDHGPGIETFTLPGATLRMGFSTKISMGMGYSIMLEVSDRVLLSTGSKGTTVILIRDLARPPQAMSLDDLPDTWDQIPSP